MILSLSKVWTWLKWFLCRLFRSIKIWDAYAQVCGSHTNTIKLINITCCLQSPVKLSFGKVSFSLQVYGHSAPKPFMTLGLYKREGEAGVISVGWFEITCIYSVGTSSKMGFLGPSQGFLNWFKKDAECKFTVGNYPETKFCVNL